MAHILIIDDSSFMRGKLRSILARENHSIEEADNGILGLQMASSGGYDAVFLDIIMPGIDGLKILSTLKEQEIAGKVIVLTADIQESVDRQCRDLGAFTVLHKPPREEEVRSALDAVLGEKQR